MFPLLIENFSCQEQASLVWQFICSVPVMVLEDVFPWMTSLLSPKEKSEVENCVKQVVPKELSLQLVHSIFTETSFFLLFLASRNKIKIISEGHKLLAD